MGSQEHPDEGQSDEESSGGQTDQPAETPPPETPRPERRIFKPRKDLDPGPFLMGERSATAVADLEDLEAELEKQNGVTLGRVLGRGNVGQAEEGSDGKMRATVRIPMDELVFDPGVLVLPHGGELELEIINEDNNSHCAVLPCNGDAKFIWLVNFSKGRATLQLDGPGSYWYGSRTGNDEGAGLTGTIVVGGEVPDEAKLDRPPQPRP